MWSATGSAIFELGDDHRRAQAAKDIALNVVEALELRTSSFRVDIPRQDQGGHHEISTNVGCVHASP